jgi:hypothetical protein
MSDTNLSIPIVDSTYNSTSIINNVELDNTNTIINSIDIYIRNIILFTSVNVHVTFMASNIIVDQQMVLITGTDYANWGNDDNYIINYVLNKYQLTKLE